MEIIRAHRRTYADAQTGRMLRRDIAVFELLPALICLGCLLVGIQLSPSAAAALLVVSGLLGALLFGAMLQASQRALDWADTAPPPGPETSSHAIFMGQLAANSGYASLVCIATAICYFFATVATGPWLSAVSAVSLAVTFHLVLVLLMVMRRVYALTDQRLSRARTGADRQRRAS